MIKRLLLFFISIQIINVFAGTTGKLAGTIKDGSTGEPAIGVNVVLVGTSFGAATNIDGKYIINNLPPGNYTVVVSAIGYQKQQFNNVKISVDFTTNLDIELYPESITLETIVVEAKNPLVRSDLTSSQVVLDADHIESLPVESVGQLLSLQAGVTQGVGGDLHIRGGRSNEIAYTINGISITNPFDNSATIQIATNAIQELSVVSGTFNAEYGNALSGIVNTVTKEGGNNYKGKLSFYTGDNLSTRKNTFFNVDAFDVLNSAVGEFTFGGPIPFTSNNVTFFLSGRAEQDDGWLYGIREHSIYDSIRVNPQDPDDITIAMTGDGKIVPMNTRKSASATAKLSYKPFSTVKISYDGLYSQSKANSYSHDYKYNPDANYNTYNFGLLQALELRHALSSSTFYTLKGSVNFHDYKRYLFPVGFYNSDGTFNEADYYAGKGLESYLPNPKYQPDHKTRVPTAYSFNMGGTRPLHDYERSFTYLTKFDMTSQLNNNHEIKFGVEGKYHELTFENFQILKDTVNYKNGTIPSTSTPYHNLYSKFPIILSGYIQDKMEFDKLVVNAGLRYDYFDPQSKYSTNTIYPTDKDPYIPEGFDKTGLLAPAKGKHQISPRFGLSFPITDRGIIHFSYGHFFQMPPFQYLFSNSEFEYSFASGSPLFGNANLNPEKTVTYEIGLQQQLFEDLAFNVTGFYKDVRDLLAVQTIRVSGDKTYLKYVNKDYGNIKGLTFSLSKRRTPDDLVGVTVDYTLQVSEGNDTDADAFFLDLSSGRQSEKVIVFLPWDQTHTLNTTVSLGKSNNWNVSFIGKVGTGLPYTPQILEQQIFVRSNSGRRPSTLNIDIMAEKTFNILDYNLVLFLKVFNLFDILNERLVYDDTGRSTYSLLQTGGGTKSTDELAATIPGMHTSADYFQRPNYYYPPREVRFGVSVEF
jgi:outer membrane receptor protein involved in Fe transport